MPLLVTQDWGSREEAMALFTFPAGFAPPHPSIEGFHGTFADRARVIVAEQRMIASSNPWDWLGNGIYFWESYEERAWNWAELQARPGDELGVVRATIQFGTCLDLDSHLFDGMLQQAFSELQAQCAKTCQPLPENRHGNRARDCAVTNILCENLERPIDTVRGTFLEGREPYPGAGHRTASHQQVCVRNGAMLGPLELVGIRLARDLPETGRLR
jgi:hypothetical protein